MSDPFIPRSEGFRDLVPWADPYIAALLDRLCRRAALEEGLADEAARAELPPPRGDGVDQRWQADWSPSNWPRR